MTVSKMHAELTVPRLRMLDLPAHCPDEGDVAAAEAELGLRLPPSYKPFVQTYGSGRASSWSTYR